MEFPNSAATSARSAKKATLPTRRYKNGTKIRACKKQFQSHIRDQEQHNPNPGLRVQHFLASVRTNVIPNRGNSRSGISLPRGASESILSRPTPKPTSDPHDGPSAGRSLVRTWNLIIRDG